MKRNEISPTCVQQRVGTFFYCIRVGQGESVVFEEGSSGFDSQYWFGGVRCNDGWSKSTIPSLQLLWRVLLGRKLSIHGA